MNRNVLQTGKNESVTVVPESNPACEDLATPNCNISQDQQNKARNNYNFVWGGRGGGIISSISQIK